MTFWGVEVQPEKPHKHVDLYGETKLHLSQATLGLEAKGKQRTVVKCQVGDNPEVLLCSLIPGVSESCALDLLFDQEVVFSVSGSASVHLTGYYMPLEDNYNSEDDEDYDSEEGFEFSEDDDGDDDFYSEEEEICPISGVTIEEVEEGEDQPSPAGSGKKGDIKAVLDSPSAKKRKKGESNVLKANGSAVKVKAAKSKVEKDAETLDDSEDEDGFVSAVKKGNTQPEAHPPKKKQAVDSFRAGLDSPAPPQQKDDVKTPSEGKKKKEKVKTQTPKVEQDIMTPEPKVNGDANKPTLKDVEGKLASVKEVKTPKKKDSPVIKKHPNGLEIEETAMGEPDGKQAKPGKRVSMYYTGRLKSNGKIFDSNIGKKPFGFRLGVGEVIKGWDVGLNGMRVGDKRRLTIPPAMAYGAQGVKNTIPGNAWLQFDVELVAVK